MKKVDEYIANFPERVQEKLKSLRKIIETKAPDAEEGFSYGMPAWKLNGKALVYFAGYKNHIGFYATPSGHAAFAEELSGFKQGKGSVQFPVDGELPVELISRIVEYRVKENLTKPE